MANQEHLDIFSQGVDVWNQWRKDHPDLQPDLSDADLKLADIEGMHLFSTNLCKVNFCSANLTRADLFGAILLEANLSGAFLMEADLSEANLSEANLFLADLTDSDLRRTNLSHANLRRATFNGAYLRLANLSETHLEGAHLIEAILIGANLSGAHLEGAHLDNAVLVGANLEKAYLADCTIHGISAWNVELKDANQTNLIITDEHEPSITVDNLEVAQFIYLLLNNKKIRDVIDTITSKVVLILGRFTPERKVVLDALRDELHKLNYSPVLFDFEKPSSRDLTETVSTLAHMARFVIADITDAKSIPQELQAIVPNLPSVPVQPMILNSQHEYGMFEHFTRYPWVLPVFQYTDQVSLLQSLKENVIAPAEQKAQELEKR